MMPDLYADPCMMCAKVGRLCSRHGGDMTSTEVELRQQFREFSPYSSELYEVLSGILYREIERLKAEAPAKFTCVHCGLVFDMTPGAFNKCPKGRCGLWRMGICGR